YPRALVAAAPEIAGLAGLGVLGLVDRDLRARWTAPLAMGAASIAFLIYGDLRDAAPTHHPQRAVMAVVWLLAAFGVGGTRALAKRVAWGKPTREIWFVGAGAAAVIAWAASRPAAWRAFPGTEAWADRTAQIARGRTLRELRDEGARAVVVTPCAYE